MRDRNRNPRERIRPMASSRVRIASIVGVLVVTA